MSLLGVDFDGVIHNHSTGEPIPGAREGLAQLKERGHSIMIHSCNNLTYIRKWLEEHGMRFDYIWGETGKEGAKPNCAVFVDDRGFKFETWNQDTIRAIHDMAQT